MTVYVDLKIQENRSSASLQRSPDPLLLGRPLHENLTPAIAPSGLNSLDPHCSFSTLAPHPTCKLQCWLQWWWGRAGPPPLGDGPMGVNATGTLAGSQVERRRRENRGAVGGEGGGVWGGAVPLPRKFMNFSSQNGAIRCILGVLFLRFMCPMDCSCMTATCGIQKFR